MADSPIQPIGNDAPLNGEFVESVRLSLVSGVGPLVSHNLIERFGSASAVFQANHGDLMHVPKVGAKLASRIRTAKNSTAAEEEIAFARQNNVQIISRGMSDYPTMLTEIHDPPRIFYCRGKLLPQDSAAVALVGSRHATRYGLAQAERLAGALARAGYTIVSGLARGIDAAVHRGAMAAGGRTIAVLGGGVLNIYPPEHKQLAIEVSEQGCVMSEAPPRMKPLSGAFPQRNRIISGLSLGVVVVEAAKRSGALISARHAGEQGREVFAVPGPIDSRMSAGCHALIQDGAKLVQSVEDVLDELAPLTEFLPNYEETEVSNAAERLLNEVEKQVFAAIESTPTSIEDIVTKCQLPIHRVLSTISVLEMRSLIKRVSGSQVIRS